VTTQKNRIILSAMAAIVALGGFYMTILKPKRQEASRLQAQVTAKQNELNAARALLSANQQAQAGYRQAYSSVVRLGKAVPSNDDVQSLVVQLDAAAKASGVDFRTINVGGGSTAPVSGAAALAAAQAAPLPPGATVGPAGFPVMPFSFAFKGSFFDLGSFFERLDSFVVARNKSLNVTGRLMTLDALKLEPDSTGFPQIKASVSATTYLVSPLEGLTGGATAQGPAGTSAAPGATAAPSTSSTAPTPTTATSTGVVR
jgi:Tfp pilus assembly protein PilO